LFKKCFFNKKQIFIKKKTKIMGRKIRLTESEFHSLVRRIVRETEEEMMSNSMDDERFKEMSYDDTVHAVAKFFKRKLRRLDDEEIEELEDMVINSKTEGLAEMFLREDISDRKKSFKEKAMMSGGIGMMGAGMLGMISQALGYTDHGDLMIKVHDFVEKMGGGPVSTAVLIAGLVMALKGMADRGLRKGR
jgi:hypothetical protein